jgi:mannose-6-phosphate isomerase-like protein (cupin superfamily)
MADHEWALKRLADGPAKNWFARRIAEDAGYGTVLNGIISGHETEGYVLDANSGIMLRERPVPYKVDSTLLDLVMPHDTDYHFHPDVIEVVDIRSGSGIFYHGPDKTPITLEEGVLLTIPVDVHHGFKPGPPKHFIEFSLVTVGGQLDMAKERCVQPFGEW